MGKHWRAGLVLTIGVTVMGCFGSRMSVEDYTPRSTLHVPTHEVRRARFPFVDVHNHQGGELTPERVDKLVKDMDALNMAHMVNLSGGNGDGLKKVVAAMSARYPNRFAVFQNPNWSGIGEAGYGERAARAFEDDVRAGAKGLKIWKDLGLTVKDTSGHRVPVDDPRLDPLWEEAGRQGLPVLIHTADPAMFWKPHDKLNERWLELKEFPGRQRGPDDPPWEQLIAEQTNLFRRHPKTTFIAAHLMWLGQDLDWLGRVLDELPNVYTETGAVIYEIGRQPRRARAFFERYQDRILFGKDIWEPSEYGCYFRVLETPDEYFDYYRRRHAFWKMYGLDLPDDLLEKHYFRNALRIMPWLDRSRFPA